MNNQLQEQQMMQPYVIEIFESFVASFYTALYEQLIDEMKNPQFSAELMEQHLQWKQTLQPVLTAQFEVDVTKIATIENIQHMKTAYIEIAQSCAAFQFTVAELLHKHFPKKYPDYFLTAHRRIEEKIAAQVQEIEQGYKVQMDHLIQQHETLQQELEQSQLASILANETLRSLEQMSVAQKNDLNQLAEINVTLRSKFEQLLKDQDLLQQQEQALQEALADSQHRLMQALAVTQSLEQNAAQQQSTVLQQQTEMNELQAQNEALTEAKKQAAHELQQQIALNKQLTEQMESAQHSRADVTNILSSVGDKLLQATKQNMKMFGQKATSETVDLQSAEALQEMVVQLEQQRETLQVQMTALQMKNSTLQEQLEQLEKEQLEAKDATIHALQQKVAILEGELSGSGANGDVQQAFERLKEKYDTDTAKLKAHINELMTQRRQQTAQPTATEGRNEEIVALEKKLADTEHRLEYFRKNNEKVVQQYLELLNNQ